MKKGTYDSNRKENSDNFPAVFWHAIIRSYESSARQSPCKNIHVIIKLCNNWTMSSSRLVLIGSLENRTSYQA